MNHHHHHLSHAAPLHPCSCIGRCSRAFATACAPAWTPWEPRAPYRRCRLSKAPRRCCRCAVTPEGSLLWPLCMGRARSYVCVCVCVDVRMRMCVCCKGAFLLAAWCCLCVQPGARHLNQGQPRHTTTPHIWKNRTLGVSTAPFRT